MNLRLQTLLGGATTALALLIVPISFSEAFTTRTTSSFLSRVSSTKADSSFTFNPSKYPSTKMFLMKSSKQDSNHLRQKDDENIKKVFAIVTASIFAINSLLIGIVSNPQPAMAESSRQIASISGSGLVFKDTLLVESFDDPKVQGVTLYISNFQRPLAERLQKDFFSDPSFASVGCAKTVSTVKIADNIAMGPQGEEVFEESKSLLFKTLRVQRVYDKEKNTVIYVSFNTRLDKNSDTNKSRFKSSICAVNLD